MKLPKQTMNNFYFFSGSIPKTIQVTDRFHVQKLALEALQDIRIKHRWDAIDLENQEIKEAKIDNKRYKPQLF